MFIVHFAQVCLLVLRTWKFTLDVWFKFRWKPLETYAYIETATFPKGWLTTQTQTGISVCFRFRKNVFQLHLSLICGLPNNVKKQIQIEKFWLKFSWFYTGVGQARCDGCVGRITSTSISVGFRTGRRGRSRTSWTATTRASRTTCSRPTRPRTATATTSPLSGKNNGGTSKRFRIALSKKKENCPLCLATDRWPWFWLNFGWRLPWFSYWT